jgi:Phage integrase, N-terminal SAM-like domain
MTDLSPLRRRMIEDMKVRNLSSATQRCYVHAVAQFAQHFNREQQALARAAVARCRSDSSFIFAAAAFCPVRREKAGQEGR